MVEQVLEIHGQARDVVSGVGFVGAAMAAEIWDNYIVVLGEGSDIALEDGPGACEAMEQDQRGASTRSVRFVMDYNTVVGFERRHRDGRVDRGPE